MKLVEWKFVSRGLLAVIDLRSSLTTRGLFWILNIKLDNVGFVTFEAILILVFKLRYSNYLGEIKLTVNLKLRCNQSQGALLLWKSTCVILFRGKAAGVL